VPVQGLLGARLKWSGTLASENDANAFAAAELYGRSPATSADALFVYLDAGVGGGMVAQGELLRGHRGYAGEIGHIHLGEQGFDRLTVVQGSFESYVGREAVLARFRHHGGEGTRLEDLIEALAAHAPAALQTISEWGWWLGRGLASLISTLDPERIVLGGPLAALYAYAEPEVLDSVKKTSRGAVRAAHRRSVLARARCLRHRRSDDVAPRAAVDRRAHRLWRE